MKRDYVDLAFRLLLLWLCGLGIGVACFGTLTLHPIFLVALPPFVAMGYIGWNL